MKREEMAKHLKSLEHTAERTFPVGLSVVFRLDGRGFTKLTKARFDKPFDPRFHEMMLETTRHLTACGFRFQVAYTQSDEISLLLHPDDDGFARKEQKLVSILAAEASAKCSILLGEPGVFDCRYCPLPRAEDISQYFIWRQEDASRNALNGHAYHVLRRQGKTAQETTQILKRKGIAFKNELLFAAGINFNELPAWQKRGTLLFWGEQEKQGRHGLTGEPVTVTRRCLQTDGNLPRGDGFAALIRSQL